MSKPYVFNGVLLDAVVDNISSDDEILLAELLSKEKFLRLILRVPISCNSSITVLEGDYTKLNEIYIQNPVPYHVIVGNLLHSESNEELTTMLNNKLLSPLSLIKMSDGHSYPIFR